EAHRGRTATESRGAGIHAQVLRERRVQASEVRCEFHDGGHSPRLESVQAGMRQTPRRGRAAIPGAADARQGGDRDDAGDEEGVRGIQDNVGVGKGEKAARARNAERREMPNGAKCRTARNAERWAESDSLLPGCNGMGVRRRRWARLDAVRYSKAPCDRVAVAIR